MDYDRSSNDTSGRIARSNATGPTSKSRKSRPPRNWRRSIPICTRRCSARATCRFRSRWSSRRSTARTTSEALDKAKASAEYLETGEGDDRRHRARFFSTDALPLRDLFELVGPVPGTEVLIDDRPIPYTRELWLPLLWFHLLH